MAFIQKSNLPFSFPPKVTCTQKLRTASICSRGLVPGTAPTMREHLNGKVETLLFFIYLFIYLASPGLSCGMWDLIVAACGI